MIPMGLLSQQDAHISDVVTHCRNVLPDQRCGIFQTTVDQDVSCIGSNQENPETRGDGWDS